MIRIVRDDENEQKLRQLGIVINAQAILGGHFRCEPPTCLDQGIGVNFHGGAMIGAFSYIVGTKLVTSHITIGRYCSIAPDFSVRQNHRMDLISTSTVFYEDNTIDLQGFKIYPFTTKDFKLIKDHPSPPPLSVEIGHDVWIGQNVFVKQGVKIGTGAIVGAHAVVTKDVPEYAIVAGVPARIIRYRYEEKYIQMLLESRWWEYAPWQLKGAVIDDIEAFVDFVNNLRAKGIPPYTPGFVEFSV